MLTRLDQIHADERTAAFAVYAQRGNAHEIARNVAGLAFGHEVFARLQDLGKAGDVALDAICAIDRWAVDRGATADFPLAALAELGRQGVRDGAFTKFSRWPYFRAERGVPLPAPTVEFTGHAGTFARYLGLRNWLLDYLCRAVAQAQAKKTPLISPGPIVAHARLPESLQQRIIASYRALPVATAENGPSRRHVAVFGAALYDVLEDVRGCFPQSADFERSSFGLALRDSQREIVDTLPERQKRDALRHHYTDSIEANRRGGVRL